jgi:hypothetical protein
MRRSNAGSPVMQKNVKGVLSGKSSFHPVWICALHPHNGVDEFYASK